MVQILSAALAPALMLMLFGLCLGKEQDAFSLLTQGAADGLRTAVRLAPTLITLMTLVTMLRASGAMALLENLLAPALRLLGIPRELAPLLLIRPISGSAALAIGAELMAFHGPDSLIGRTTAVTLGSTETTLYALSVYFGAAGVEKSRYTLPAALIADLTGFLMASLCVRLFF